MCAEALGFCQVEGWARDVLGVEVEHGIDLSSETNSAPSSGAVDLPATREESAPIVPAAPAASG